VLDHASYAIRPSFRVRHAGTALARSDRVDTTSDETRRYTAKCIYCARIIFTSARNIGDNQLRMVEHHILVCRPLIAYERHSELLTHFRIAATAA
jgi:hypothetical protein